jgi:flagellar basal-body rod protein FlgF
MIRGLYTAAAGMLAGLLRHETTVHNLANVRTVGYKADRAVVSDFPSMLLAQVNGNQSGPVVGKTGTGVSLAALVTDFSEGPLTLTDHPFDFAVAGDGFFRLETPEGVRYTRDGRFHRDVDGRLVTANGYPVLGNDGPIILPQGQLTVTDQGGLFVDNTFVDQFSLAHFDDLQDLVKDGQTTFAHRGGEPALVAAEDVQIYQGYLEESNVDTAQSTSEMMSVLRAYQLSQRLVQYQDRVNGQSVSDLGSV